jgi:hypothetical protein
MDDWGKWRLNLQRRIMNNFNQILLEAIKLALAGIIGCDMRSLEQLFVMDTS